jgi:two-component system, OmpR family, catabolic regulation response regulator CreB
MHHVLLLEDDPAIAKTVVFALEREGFHVRHCTLLGDARTQLARQHFDALILDVGLPDGNGLDLCRSLRQASGTQASAPILMLSARGEELDRVLGLELGADDYMAKPFSPRELVARMRALLRRSAHQAAAAQATQYTQEVPAAPSAFQIDSAGQRISLQGQALDLTRREYGLLAQLLQVKGRILSRELLLDAVWGLDADSTDRTVDTHIKTLRAKLRAVDASTEHICTHRGMGYSIAP